jgi:NRPS condensation-like uncharacterized protein
MSEEQAEQQPEQEHESSQELESLRTEVEGLHKRMEEIRAATEEEVLKNWQSPWKGADTVKAKVDSRLASNHEFRAIMTRARTAEATAAELDPAEQATAEQSPTGHPAIGR